MLFQNWTIHGLYWGSYFTHRPPVLIDSLNELFSWLSKGLIKIQISHTYRLPEVSDNILTNLIMITVLVTLTTCHMKRRMAQSILKTTHKSWMQKTYINFIRDSSAQYLYITPMFWMDLSFVMWAFHQLG